MDHLDVIRRRCLGQLLVMLLLTKCHGQFYGRALPCPVSYVDPDGDCVAGIAGKDYPMLSSVPKTSFQCSDHKVKFLGYFADPEAMCQVFHVCTNNDHWETFLCPNGTLFNQQFLLCDWWFHVKCSDAQKFYEINEYLQPPLAFQRGPVHPNVMPISSEKLQSSPTDQLNSEMDPNDGFKTTLLSMFQRSSSPVLRPTVVPLGQNSQLLSGNQNPEPYIMPRTNINVTSAPRPSTTKDWSFDVHDSVDGSNITSGVSQTQDFQPFPMAYPKLNDDIFATTPSPPNANWPHIGFKEMRNAFLQHPPSSSSWQTVNSKMAVGSPRK